MYKSNIIIVSVLFFSAFVIMNSCRKDDPTWNLENIPPKVQTISVTEIKATSALVSAKIIHNGGTEILEKGVCFGFTKNPTVENASKLVNSENAEIYSLRIQTLSPSKTYYIRAYARNKKDIAYGEELSITTTSCSPSVTTTNIFSITSNSASSGGLILSDGSVSITSKGVVWSTEQSPTILLSTKTNNGTGTSSFTSQLTGLSANTRYYVRSYATNSCTTSYGNEVNFITSSCNPAVSTNTISNITSNSASSGGFNLSDGGVSITSKGVVWSTSPNPTTSLATKTNNGSGASSFTSQITGLSINTRYYVRSYATNSCTTSYGNEVNFTTSSCNPVVSTNTISNITSNSASSGGFNLSDGGVNITSKGVVWSTSPNPTTFLSTKTNEGSGSGSFTSQISGLSSNTTYYVRAYVVNSCGTALGNQVQFTTSSSSLFTGTITTGTGTSSETTTADPAVTPFGSYYSDAKHVYLIRASEITNQGGRSGNISSISFDVVGKANIGMNNFSIKLGNTSLSEFNANSTSFSYVVTTNYNPFNLSGFSTGWIEFPLNTPFFWNGSQNIIIEACFDNSTFSQNSTVRFSNTSFFSNIFNFRDNSSGCSLPLMYLHNQRPNMRLNFK